MKISLCRERVSQIDLSQSRVSLSIGSESLNFLLKDSLCIERFTFYWETHSLLREIYLRDSLSIERSIGRLAFYWETSIWETDSRLRKIKWRDSLSIERLTLYWETRSLLRDSLSIERDLFERLSLYRERSIWRLTFYWERSIWETLSL